MKKKIFKTLIIALCIFGIDGCKPEPKPDPSNSSGYIEVLTNKSNYSHFEIATIDLNFGFSFDTLTVQIDSVPILILKTESKKMGFFINPKLKPGIKKMQIKYGDTILQTSFSILEAIVISNPTQYVNDYYNSISNELVAAKKRIDSDTSGLIDKSKVNSTITLISDSLNKLKTQFNTLTPEGKAICANVIQSNRVELDLIRANTLGIYESLQEGYYKFGKKAHPCAGLKFPQMYQCSFNLFKNDLIQFIGTATRILGTTAAVSYFAFTVGQVGAGAFAIVLGFSWLYLDAGDLMVSLYQNSVWFAKVNFALVYGFSWALFNKKSGDAGYFTIDQPKSLKFQIKYRNISEEDKNSKLEWVSKASITFKDFIDLSKKKYMKFFKLEPEFKTQSEKIQNISDMNYLSVKNISNPTVKFVGISGNVVDLKLAFTSSSKMDESFEFDLVYNDGLFPEISSKFNGIIRENPCKGDLKVSTSINGKTITASATGGKAPYEYAFLNYYAGNNFSSTNTFTLKYDGHYMVIVKDANGCMDTLNDCISDVTINKVECISESPGTPNSRGYFELVFTSPLGLLPDWSFIHDNTKNEYTMSSWTVNSTHSYYKTKTKCGDISGLAMFRGLKLTDLGDGVKKFTKTFTGSDVYPATISFRFLRSGGASYCSPEFKCENINNIFTKQYTISW